MKNGNISNKCTSNHIYLRIEDTLLKKKELPTSKLKRLIIKLKILMKLEEEADMYYEFNEPLLREVNYSFSRHTKVTIVGLKSTKNTLCGSKLYHRLLFLPCSLSFMSHTTEEDVRKSLDFELQLSNVAYIDDNKERVYNYYNDVESFNSDYLHKLI